MTFQPASQFFWKTGIFNNLGNPGQKITGMVVNYMLIKSSYKKSRLYSSRLLMFFNIKILF